MGQDPPKPKVVRRFLWIAAYFFYGLAVFLMVITSTSLAYSPKFSYTAEIDLNGKLNGTLNEASVTNLEKIRLGNWGTCYFTSQSETGSGICPQGGGFFYKLTFIEAMPGSTSTTVIVQPWWSATLAFDLVALLPTGLTLFYEAFPACFWVEISAMAMIVVAGLLKLVFLLLVKGGMQSFGEGIVTYPGSAFTYLGAAVGSLILAAIFRNSMIKLDAKEKSKPADKKSEIAYTIDREVALDYTAAMRKEDGDRKGATRAAATTAKQESNDRTKEWLKKLHLS